jgi:hypothetical protein
LKRYPDTVAKHFRTFSRLNERATSSDNCDGSPSMETFWERYFYRCCVDTVLLEWDVAERQQLEEQFQSTATILAAPPAEWAFSMRQKAEQVVVRRRNDVLTYTTPLQFERQVLNLHEGCETSANVGKSIVVTCSILMLSS